MDELDKYLEQLQKSQSAMNAANLAREKEIRAITDEIIRRYSPGGAFQQAGLQQLATQKVSDVGAGMQRLISSGLAGTEAAGALETGWEQAVGAPARLSLEDLMMQRLSEAQLGKAGFLERVETQGPDYGLIASLAGQASQPRYAAPSGYQAAPSESLWSKDVLSMPTGGAYAGAPTTAAITGTGPTPGGTPLDIQFGQPVGYSYQTPKTTETVDRKSPAYILSSIEQQYRQGKISRWAYENAKKTYGGG